MYTNYLITKLLRSIDSLFFFYNKNDTVFFLENISHYIFITLRRDLHFFLPNCETEFVFVQCTYIEYKNYLNLKPKYVLRIMYLENIF